ncbi:uncharacterized protein LOC117407083 isoform X3 [Acipenser ruthenus]|uniref:uncharacterized protein LOC117407083 isoform X3 n=1 Tax=Acipenser ruthenus TaxID=7906 RepID=UPI00274048AA|nr:uncharacterized protein LOC117407083 isoform X3 [Acipenser ruthenus]
MDTVQFNVSIIDNGTEPPAESGSGLVTILLAILAFIIIILITSFFFKRILLVVLRSCCKSAIPATISSNKQECEEFEPYEIYVEKMNYIYS